MMSSAALQVCKKGAMAAAVALSLGLATDRDAEALTVLLNFVNGPTTDRFNVGTLPETFASWGFTGMSLTDIRNATLAAVQNPLRPGLELMARCCRGSLRLNRSACAAHRT